MHGCGRVVIDGLWKGGFGVGVFREGASRVGNSTANVGSGYLGSDVNKEAEFYHELIHFIMNKYTDL